MSDSANAIQTVGTIQTVSARLDLRALEGLFRIYDQQGLTYSLNLTRSRSGILAFRVWVEGVETAHELRLACGGAWSAATKVEA